MSIGLYATYAILAALHHRDSRGGGGNVSVGNELQWVRFCETLDLMHLLEDQRRLLQTLLIFHVHRLTTATYLRCRENIPRKCYERSLDSVTFRCSSYMPRR